MSEFTIEQLIKIIIGTLVFVAVVIGVYFIFKNKIIDFFGGISAEDSTKIFLGVLKWIKKDLIF